MRRSRKSSLLLLLLPLFACGKPGAPELIRGDDPLWDEDALSRMHLNFEENDWEGALLDASGGGDELCVDAAPLTASLEFQDPSTSDSTTWSDIKVTLQGLGALSSAGKDERTGFHLVFDPAEGGIGGEEELILAGTDGDTSLGRALLANRVGRRIGLPSPRGGYTALWVNDELQGIFPLQEVTGTRSYLSSRYADSSGPLFRSTDHCGSISDLEYHGDLESDYIGRYNAVADTSPRAILDGLVPLLACTESADEDSQRSCIEGFIEVDAWLDAIALGMALPDVSGFATQSVSYSIYQDPSSGLLSLIPAATGQSFQLWALQDPSTGIFSLETRNYELKPPTLVTQLLELYPERYCERMAGVLSELDPERFGDEVGELGAFLWDPVASDPGLDADRWRSQINLIQDSLSERQPGLKAAAATCAY